MKKVAIFTEGQGELIFIRHLLVQLVGYNDLSFECFELHSEKLRTIPYRHVSPTAIIHYQIINVGTDEKVLSAIIERHEKLVERGYEIVGLRDMYSEAYQKRSHEIDQPTTTFFIETSRQIIAKSINLDKIHFYFAIMEFEAWLIAFHNNLARLDSSLTPENIEQRLQYDILAIDPENYFFHPAVNFGEILSPVGIKYDKSRDILERIVSTLILDDFDAVLGKGICNSFSDFYLEIQRELAELNEQDDYLSQ